MEFLNAQQGGIGRTGLTDIAIGDQSYDPVVLVDHRQVPDLSFTDKGAGFKVRGFRSDGERVFSHDILYVHGTPPFFMMYPLYMIVVSMARV
jgi:hypothetical protein